jgi:hypothetical protein
MFYSSCVFFSCWLNKVDTKKRAEDVCRLLMASGIASSPLHQGRLQDDRMETMRWWEDSNYDMSSATPFPSRGVKGPVLSIPISSSSSSASTLSNDISLIPNELKRAIQRSFGNQIQPEQMMTPAFSATTSLPSSSTTITLQNEETKLKQPTSFSSLVSSSSSSELRVVVSTVVCRGFDTSKSQLVVGLGGFM